MVTAAELKHRLHDAIDAVQLAARAWREVEQNANQQGLVKNDGSPVTVADLTSQAIVSMVLAKATPAIPLVAEEDSSELTAKASLALLGLVARFVSRAVGHSVDREAVLQFIHGGGGHECDTYWALDPVDGTEGFLSGEQYAIALALVTDKAPRVGVIACPRLLTREDHAGVFVAAVDGMGTYQGHLSSAELQQRLAVSAETNVPAVSYCESVDSRHSNMATSRRLAQILGIQSTPVRMHSQAKYLLVAQGKVEMYLRIPNCPSDRYGVGGHAAGAIVVKEAGGCVTDILGRQLDFSCGRQLRNNLGILATNGHIHHEVLCAMRACLPSDW